MEIVSSMNFFSEPVKFQLEFEKKAVLKKVQLNIHETDLLFRYLSHLLTKHCLLISLFFPISCLFRS